ncbi:MAG: YegS/Rv2252/BmrU family lipid kinase [Halioglobus sp.]|jgi:YegS/Rv2252/BmrU family lipid kinase
MAKYYLIVNPMSGHKKGHSILEKIKPVFAKGNIELVIDITTHKNHPYELAKTKSLEGIDAICIAGGDGTFHEVINGMQSRPDKKRLPLGFIPAGTGNSMMHDMDCLDPVEAVHRILANKLSKLDVFEIKTNEALIYGFNILGWGIPVSINRLAEKMRWLGRQRYNIASIIEVMKNKTQYVEIEIDDTKLEGEFGFFIVCNTMYTGNGMKMAPDALFDDGYLDILIAKKVGRLKLLSLFAKVFNGNHIGDSTIAYYRAKEFSIKPVSHDQLIIDGQNIGYTPVRGKILSQQIDIFI